MDFNEAAENLRKKNEEKEHLRHGCAECPVSSRYGQCDFHFDCPKKN